VRRESAKKPLGWDWDRPLYIALPLASSMAGYLAAFGVVIALSARHRSGHGQRIEVPLLDAMFTLIRRSGASADEPGCRPRVPFGASAKPAWR